MTTPEFVLPEAMVEAAARVLFNAGRPHGTDGWADLEEEYRPLYLVKTRAILNAAIAGCEVREEWGVRSTWPNGDVADYVRGPRHMADATIKAQERSGFTTGRSLIRQLIITTPPEEVPS